MVFAPNVTNPQDFWSDVVQHRITHIHEVSRAGPSVAQARKAIDNELAAIHRAMCTLRTRHNALTAVSFLPPETLIHVFQLYAANLPPSTNKERPLGWIEVTHVCKAWRETALNCPGLWSEICFKLGRQWVDLMLDRTRGTPVAIRHYIDKETSYEYYSSLVLEHFHRTRHLELSGSSSFMQPMATSLSSPPRVLETLELISYYSHSSPPATQLPNPIANSYLPSLRRFALRGFWVPWSAPVLCNARLTHLEIELDAPGCTAPRQFLATISSDDILSALENMHSLEVLRLWKCLPLEPGRAVGSNVISLPRLTSLSLEGLATACFSISERLELHPTCRRQFLWTEYTQGIEEVLPVLRGHIHLSPDLPPLHTLMIRRLRQDGYYVKFWRSYEAPLERQPFFLQPDADLWVQLPPSEPRLAAVQAFCELLPTDVVRSIQIDLELEDHPWTYHDWISVFGRFTAVTTARIGGDPSMAFCNALTATMHDVAENIERGTEDHYFLPNLEELSITSVHFESWGDRFSAEDTATHRSLLRRWLRDRRDTHGLPPLSVHLKWCSIKAKWIRALERIVTVTWDDFEGLCEESESGEDSEDD